MLRPQVEERLLRGARSVQESPAEGATHLPFSPNLDRASSGDFLETGLQFGWIGPRQEA